MKVEAIYRPELFAIDVEGTIAEAAGSMQFNEIGALPVFDAHRFVGIVTERDVVRAVAEGADASETPVRDYMTSDPAWATPETTLRAAANQMLEMGVRHLPVVLGGEVVGMVSARDLLIEVEAQAEPGTVSADPGQLFPGEHQQRPGAAEARTNADP